MSVIAEGHRRSEVSSGLGARSSGHGTRAFTTRAWHQLVWMPIDMARRTQLETAQ